MANLKDLIVNGAARVIGNVYSSGGFVGNLTGNVTGTADKATNDVNGKPITSTYATKTELGNINSLLDTINGEVI